MTDKYTNFLTVNNKQYKLSEFKQSGFKQICVGNCNFTGFKHYVFKTVNNKQYKLSEFKPSGFETVNNKQCKLSEFKQSGFEVITGKIYSCLSVYTPIISATYKRFETIVSKQHSSKLQFSGFNYVNNKQYYIDKIKPFEIGYIQNNEISVKIQDNTLIIELLKDGKIVYTYRINSDYVSDIVSKNDEILKLIRIMNFKLSKLGI